MKLAFLTIASIACFSVPGFSFAASTTTPQVADLQQTVNSLIETASSSFHTTYGKDTVQGTIVASSPSFFGFPHGTMERNGSIILGTVREDPGQIILFPNLKDLHSYISTTTPGFMNLASVDYDSVHGRYYFVASRIDNRHLEILSVDPKTLDWKPVYEFPGISDIGYSTINTDGSYAYISTQSSPGYLLKVALSDWTLQKSAAHPEVKDGFHSAAFYTYLDREEWYVNTFSSPSFFYKVNPATLNTTSVQIPQVPQVTDDVYFKSGDAKGGILYDISESIGGIVGIDTNLMTTAYHSSLRSYGLYSDGKDLYAVNPFDSGITKYKNFNLDKPFFIKFPGNMPINEGFLGISSNTGFFTTFATSSALYEFSY